MHSSRMRTGRSLTVWRGGGFLASGGLPAGGVLPAGGFSLPGGSPCQGGLLARGGSPCQGGFSLPGGSPYWRPPYEQNDKQVYKYYLGHNFVAAGNEIWGTISLAVWNPLPNYVADGRASPATFSSTRV